MIYIILLGDSFTDGYFTSKEEAEKWIEKNPGISKLNPEIYKMHCLDEETK